jgi:hypothetical protein
MARIIQAEARITAVDATGETFAKIAAKVRGLSSSFRSLGNVSTTGIGNMNRTIGRLHRTVSALAPIAGPAAAFAGARGIEGIVHETMKAAAAGQHETLRAEAAGMTPDEVQRETALALEMSKKYMAFSQTQVQHMLRNLRSISTGFAEAAAEIEPMLKLRTLAQAAKPGMGEQIEEDFDLLAKALEMRGVTLQPDKMANLAEGMGRAINVFGDTLRVSDYYDMIRYGREAALGWNQQFLTTIAPSLAQRLGGGVTGRSLDMAFRELVGGKISNKAAGTLASLGLLDPSSVIRTKTGSIKGVAPGGIKGAEVFTENPRQWVEDVFMPALKAHGITSQNQILATVGSIFAARAGSPIAYMALQSEQFKKDIALLEKAPGLGAAQMFLNKDFIMNWQEFESQFTNLLRAAGSPLVGPATAGLHAIAEGISAFVEANKKAPWLAPAALGGGAIGLGALTLWGAKKTLGLGRSLFSGAAPAADLSAEAAVRAMQGLAPTAAPAFGWFGSAMLPLAIGSTIGELEKAAPPDLHTYWRDRGGPGSEIGIWPALKAYEWLTGKSATSTLQPTMPKPEVKGSADLNVQVQVEPSDNFISRIITAIENRINAFGGSEPGSGVGTAGSTGLSMPPAVPAP